MIKKFFAKLASWNSERNQDWEKGQAQMNIEQSRARMNHEKEMAEERRRASIHAVPQEERMRRLKEDVEVTVENPDKAA